MQHPRLICMCIITTALSVNLSLAVLAVLLGSLGSLLHVDFPRAAAAVRGLSALVHDQLDVTEVVGSAANLDALVLSNAVVGASVRLERHRIAVEAAVPAHSSTWVD